MAVTSGKNKVRLDYSALIDEAISSNSIEIEEAPAAPETPKEAPVKEKIKPIKEASKPPKKETTPKAEKAPKEKSNSTALDPLDAKFSLKQKGRGVQKSVYLEEDVHNYIQSKCDKYNIKYSQVLNEILREAIKAYKN